MSSSQKSFSAVVCIAFWLPVLRPLRQRPQAEATEAAKLQSFHSHAFCKRHATVHPPHPAGGRVLIMDGARSSRGRERWQRTMKGHHARDGFDHVSSTGCSGDYAGQCELPSIRPYCRHHVNAVGSPHAGVYLHDSESDKNSMDPKASGPGMSPKIQGGKSTKVWRPCATSIPIFATPLIFAIGRRHGAGKSCTSAELPSWDRRKENSDLIEPQRTWRARIRSHAWQRSDDLRMATNESCSPLAEKLQLANGENLCCNCHPGVKSRILSGEEDVPPGEEVGAIPSSHGLGHTPMARRLPELERTQKMRPAQPVRPRSTKTAPVCSPATGQIQLTEERCKKPNHLGRNWPISFPG